jgi:hypothetical protein
MLKGVMIAPKMLSERSVATPCFHMTIWYMKHSRWRDVGESIDSSLSLCSKEGMKEFHELK